MQDLKLSTVLGKFSSIEAVLIRKHIQKTPALNLHGQIGFFFLFTADETSRKKKKKGGGG